MPKYQNNCIFYFIFFNNLKFLIMKQLLKIGIVALLLLNCNITIAKSYCFSLCKSDERTLSEKLAKNAVFEDYAVDLANIYSKIVSTKSQQLFANFISKHATTEETNLLFKNLGYNSYEEFDLFTKSFLQKEKIIAENFSEIKSISENERKEVLKEAFALVNQSKSFKVKTLNVYVCWGEWAFCMFGCGIAFPTNTSEYWYCVAGCEILFGFCWYGEQ